MDKIQAQQRLFDHATNSSDDGLTATAAGLLVSMGIMAFILFLVNQRRVRYWAARLTR